MNIDSKGTIMIHSSMKSIGEVEGGAEAVLDVFSGFMTDGLLVFPTHTWDYVQQNNPYFYVRSSRSHVGILTELFRQRPNVVRSWHPTHSVAALGEDAEEFTANNEKFETPAARASSYGKLLDREAKILLIGVDLKRNTFIHGIEEWENIPGRFQDGYEDLVTVLPDGTEIPVPSKRHIPGFSMHYWKVEELLFEKGVIEYEQFGDAKVLVCDTVGLTKYITQMLDIEPELFSDNEPLSEEFIETFRKQTS
jgi:aminoglycoside 3-N-acetyltransferase